MRRWLTLTFVVALTVLPSMLLSSQAGAAQSQLEIDQISQDYRAQGFVYVCSLRAYYDLHLAVRRTSEHAPELTRAVRAQCAKRGYVLPGGFSVETGKQRVSFANW